MLKRRHKRCIDSRVILCLFGSLVWNIVYCYNFEDWQKASAESAFRLQCSLKCYKEFFANSRFSNNNDTFGWHSIQSCGTSIQSGCSECVGHCEKLVPRLLRRTASSSDVAGSSGNLGRNNADLSCGCASAFSTTPTATTTAATVSSSGKVAAAVSSKSLPRQNEESRRNASKLMCQRVCKWAREIISTGGQHHGSCPAFTNRKVVAASKLSVRSPDMRSTGNDFVEPYMNDQAKSPGSGGIGRTVGGVLSGPSWRGSSTKLISLPPFKTPCGLKMCKTDADCDWSERCCPSQACNAPACLQATIDEKSMNTFKIVSFNLDSDKRIARFNWIPPPQPPDDPATLYLLELSYLIVPPNSRADIKELTRNKQMSAWMTVANTSQANLILNKAQIWPSTWYKFRIVRLSATASIAVSRPVGPVKIDQELRELSEPRNISAIPDMWYLNVNDPESVDGMITWLPPYIKDIPVTKYKIFYTQYVPSNVLAILSSPPEFKKSVPGHATSIRLKHLIPETTYRVDVQAISRLPAVKMRSSKATVYIRTVALDEAADPPGGTRRSTISAANGYFDSKSYGNNYGGNRNTYQVPPSVEGLRVGEIIYAAMDDYGSVRLEVVVSWLKPDFPAKPESSTPSVLKDAFGDDDEDFQSSQANPAKNALRYIVEWAPLSCIQQEPASDNPLKMAPIIRRLSLVTLNTSVTLHTLLPTCFYEVSVTSLDPTNGRKGQKQTQTFRTPLCATSSHSASPCNVAPVKRLPVTTLSTTITTTNAPLTIDSQEQAKAVFPPATPKTVDRKGSVSQMPAPVNNIQFRVVSADNSSIMVQWDPAPASSAFTAEHLLYSWSIYPSLEPSNGRTRQLQANRSRVIMRNLKPGVLYVVSVISVARRRFDGELLQSPPARVVVLLPSTTTPASSPRQRKLQNRRKQSTSSSSPLLARTNILLLLTKLMSQSLLVYLVVIVLDFR